MKTNSLSSGDAEMRKDAGERQRTSTVAKIRPHGTVDDGDEEDEEEGGEGEEGNEDGRSEGRNTISKAVKALGSTGRVHLLECIIIINNNDIEILGIKIQVIIR